MSQKTKHFYAFGPFFLDASECLLILDGKPVPLAPKAFEALVILVENAGHLVDKDDLMRRLWPDSFVEEGNVAKHVSLLRKVLSEATNGREYIETIPKRGYRFVEDVREVSDVEDDSQPHSLPGTNLIGKRVSHYRVLEILGGGGMGVVYRAEDLKLGRLVALKFLPEELGNDPKTVERFEREARAASALDHPNVCSIYEFGDHEGKPFIVMQLLEGQTLRERIAIESQHGKPLPTSELLDLAIQITSGLEAAHQKGIIHRDIKPTNIFITNRGEAKILDFGVAKLVKESGEPHTSANPDSPNTAILPDAASSLLTLTQTGLNLGTASYMSPEQIRGEKLDTRSDLFSFGLVLQEMATGQHPFAGETAEMVRVAILQRPVQPARQLNPELPSKVEEVIAKALQKDRNLRYQHASEMCAELEGLGRDLAPMRPFTRWRELAAGIVAVLMIASVVLWFGKRRPFAPVPDLKVRQLTTNSTENDVMSGTISPDGKYLAYSDASGMHIQNIESGERQAVTLPESLNGDKAEWEVGFWSADSTRFFANAHQPGQDHRSWSSQGTSIWVVSVLGGVPRKLRDEAESSKVSPDGSSVSFATNKGRLGDREIWLMDPTGEHARKVLGPDQESSIGQLNWSRNSKRVIYQKSDSSGNQILSRDLEGGTPTRVLSPSEAAGLRDYVWLPDGRLIFTSGEAEAYGGNNTCNFWQMRLDASTGKLMEKPRRLTNWPGLCSAGLSTTADGKRLAFMRGSLHFTTYVADLDATGTRIANTKHFTLNESVDAPGDWTADSKNLLLVSDQTGTYGIYSRGLDEDTEKPLVSGQKELRNARLSPDGNWVLYHRDINPEDPVTPTEILRVPIAGGSPEVIATTRADGFVLCARAPSNLCAIAESTEDRKRIVFTAFDPVKGRGPEITRFDFDFTAGAWQNVALSPDGTRLAVIRSPEGPIHILTLQGQAAKEITLKGWSNLQSVDWTADGTGLFVSNGIQRGVVLLHVDLKGNAQVLWKNHGFNTTAARPSPDGRHLAIVGSTGDNNIWMMENF